jgi:hypothetical protein
VKMPIMLMKKTVRMRMVRIKTLTDMGRL